MSAALYLWAAFTLGWDGSVVVHGGPSVVLRRYSEALDDTRLRVELSPCTVSLDDTGRLGFESSVESSILAAAREQP